MDKLQEIRIMLVGKTGSGKSSTGNTIVGDNVFQVSPESKSCTTKSQKAEFKLGNTRYIIMDTPGIYDTNLPTLKQLKELILAVKGTSPGFHIIAFVMRRGDRYTEELQETQKRFFDWFGNDVDKFACLILTNTSTQHEKDEYLNNPHEDLSILLKRTKDRLAFIQNGGATHEKRKQRDEFLNLVHYIVDGNNGKSFENVMSNFITAYIENADMTTISEKSLKLLNLFPNDGFVHAAKEIEKAISNPKGAKIGKPIIIDEDTGEVIQEMSYSGESSTSQLDECAAAIENSSNETENNEDDSFFKTLISWVMKLSRRIRDTANTVPQVLKRASAYFRANKS